MIAENLPDDLIMKITELNATQIADLRLDHEQKN